MKILVTGASGKLGQAICSKLLINKNEVVGFDLEAPVLKNELYNHVIGNLTDQVLLKSALSNCDVVIHSAVSIGIDYNKQPDLAFETNVYGTYVLYKTLRELSIQKAILLSSAPVDKNFPNSNEAYKWTSNNGQDHTYDLTKRLQEEIAQEYSETFKIQTVILRIGHVVDGPKNENLDGESLSGFSYCSGGWVDKNDIANACFLALQYTKTDIFNVIGSQQAETPFNIGRTIEALGWKPKYQF